MAAAALSRTPARRPPALRSLALAAAFAALYFIAGKLALLLAIPPGYATPVWPPSGIALAGILLLGYRYAPAVALGSFIANSSVAFDASNTAASLATAGGIAVGAALQALAGAALVRRYVGFPTDLARVRDIVRFFVFGALAGCWVNATIGPLTLLMGGAIAGSNYAFTALTWWVGDAIGVLTFAPLVLIAAGRRGSLWRGRWLTVALPLGAVFAVMVVWFAYSSALEVRAQQTHFEERSGVIADIVKQQRDRYLEVLHGVVALFETSHDVTANSFQSFTRSALERHPGIFALAWLPRVAAAERAGFERAARQEGRPRFEITEQRGEALVRAPARSEYFPVQYVTPPTASEIMRGFDAASGPLRRAALHRAAVAGEPIATPLVPLVGEAASRLGILVFAPVSEGAGAEARIRGYAVLAFQLGNLLAPALDAAKREDLRFELIDESAAPEARLLFSTLPSASDVAVDAGGIRWTTLLETAGRTWRIEFTPTARYFAAQRSWGPWTALALGLLFAGLLGIVLLVQTGHAAATEAQVAERTGQLSAACEALARGERFLRSMTDTMPAMIAYLDAALRFRFHNRAYEDWLGLSAAQIHGKHPREAFGPAIYAIIEPWAARALAGEECVYEREQQSRDGAMLHLECRYVPDRGADGKVIGFFALVTDVTARKTAADELRMHQQALERSNRELRDFAHVISHDLKEPLRAITTTLGMIAQRFSGRLEGDTATLMRLATDAARRQSRQIDDLLAYTRVGSDTAPSAPVDLSVLVQQIVADFGPLVSEHGAEVNVANLPTVIGHPSQLRQLIQNLLGNALKFRAPERQPRVDISALRRGDRWELCVSDNGIGIEGRYREAIFGLFQRLHTVDEYPGSGIGLAICKKVVERHNGTIWVESTPGQGSSFFFTLPISDEVVPNLALESIG